MPNESSPLTRRQHVVADLLSKRMTIKEIASEMDISESGVNKHIAALKRRFGVNALSEVVAAWRATEGEPEIRLRESPCPNPHLAESPASTPSEAAKDGRDLSHAAQASEHERQGLGSPQVLPRWFEGRNPILRRLAAILAIIVGLLAAIVLAVTSMRSLSETVSGTEPDLVLRNGSAE